MSFNKNAKVFITRIAYNYCGIKLKDALLQYKTDLTDKIKYNKNNEV